MSNQDREHWRSNISSFNADLGGGVTAEMDGVAMTSKTDFSDDKVNDTHSYAGLMSADAYAKQRSQLEQDAGDSRLSKEDLQALRKKRDEDLKAKQDTARKAREEEKKRKLKAAMEGKDEDGSSTAQHKKKKKKKDKKKKKKEALLSFDPDE